MIKDTPTQLSPVTRILHWIVAVTIIGLLASGVYMTQLDAYSVYPWHKSFGILISVFVLARVIWRIHNGWPVPIGNRKALEQLAAKVVHYMLIIGSIVMPLSGMLMSGLGGHGLSIFGFELLARNIDPANPTGVLPINKDIAQLAHIVHGWAAYILLAAVLLHIAGALKHHVIDKDNTLRRMLGLKML